MIVIKTDQVEFEILPDISIFMGKKDKRGVDYTSELREWNDLTPSGEDAIRKVLKELNQIVVRLNVIMVVEECKEFLEEHGVKL